MSCSFWTAVQALYHPTRLGLVEPPAKASGEEWILIYSGSCKYTKARCTTTYLLKDRSAAVGQFAVRLAALSGYKVVSTASPQNFDLVKSLGALEVFDYHDPDVVSKIKKATRDSIKRAFDAISESDTQRISAESMAPSGGLLILTRPAQPEVTSRKDVKFQRTSLCKDTSTLPC